MKQTNELSDHAWTEIRWIVVVSLAMLAGLVMAAVCIFEAQR